MRALLLWPLRVVDRVIDRIVAVLGAISLSQLPGFMQHYSQRLGGHLAEAQHNLQTWLEVAEEANIDGLPKLVDAYLASDRVEVVEAGRKCAADIARVDHLQDAAGALADASPLERPIAFMRHMDADVARASLAEFSPNVPLDLESLVYALVGLLVAALLYLGLKRGGTRCIHGVHCAVCRKRDAAATAGNEA